MDLKVKLRFMSLLMQVFFESQNHFLGLWRWIMN
jgi:hypothetical protein